MKNPNEENFHFIILFIYHPLPSDKYAERQDYVDEARNMDEVYFNRLAAAPKFNYLDRDLQLPVQIHQNAQSFRDSPDEGNGVV